jgi:hypothetical protein
MEVSTQVRIVGAGSQRGPPLAGFSLEEKYLQGSRKIGSGAFSTLFAGTARASGKVVAIKVIDRSKMQWVVVMCFKMKLKISKLYKEGLIL